MKNNLQNHGMLKCNACSYNQPLERKHCGRCAVKFTQHLGKIKTMHRAIVRSKSRRAAHRIAFDRSIVRQIRNSRNYTII